MQRRRFMQTAMGLGALALAAPLPRAGTLSRSELPGGMRLYAGADLAFGTVIGVKLLHADGKIAERAIAEALAEAKRIDALMSLYRPDSQVARLNRDGALDTPDRHLLTVLDTARDVSALTDGAFDITVQPLWHLASQGRATKDALPLLGWRRVRSDTRRIALDAGMAITLNGIAQGYALDLARAALAARGIRHALIDTGEFGSLGRADGGRPWTLGVRDPRREDGILDTLALDGRSIATSGDYATAFSADFARHHIFDPATGASPLELAETVVAAPYGILADALSTAFMVTGHRRALEIAATLPGVDVLLVGKDGRIARSKGMMHST
ncbi:FAD:protein FMN transferase [Noviherbaspirillum pedocola]|uniref:FAD:protein FMN transferase n=1 Tax=Noviherbaspirillum pedocola TaxID=2801341 RepID=A0A934SYE2_9BURK|nr:FAD:protein FMN transferase [Noviherbaspirillum pedocola]MBK4734018.1 FAD:protein FMN transferase [Noviherbaspirillum pedocola]